jgi:hypothetical protein
LRELFIDVRVRSGDALFPVHAQLTSSEVELVKGVPEGRGIMLGDGAFDAKPVLNAIASRDTYPIAKRARWAGRYEALGMSRPASRAPSRGFRNRFQLKGAIEGFFKKRSHISKNPLRNRLPGARGASLNIPSAHRVTCALATRGFCNEF